MVRLATSFIFIAGLVVSGIATPFKRTVAQVEADIASISSQTTTLDNNIKSFANPGGTLAQALAIHTSSQSLLMTVNTGTTDVKNTGTVSAADGRTILNSVEAFEPTILDALSQIVAKKPAFVALPVGGIPALILSDLQALSAATSSFETALIAAAPASLVTEATGVKNTIDAAFATAIAAYS